ncbi:MAG: diguanylate cyclase [Luteimonas sp.]
MSASVEHNANAAEQAARELARLTEQIGTAREQLGRLQEEIVESEHRLAGPQAARLVQANEQPVIATLRAQTQAGAAAQALEEVSRSAELDVLTGLPNRVLLHDRLTHAIANARRHETQLALLFVDLDDFKRINDTHGHAVGDDVLKHAAQCLAASIRDADTVSRHGGDEFLILLDEVSEAADAGLVADKMIATLGAPYSARGPVLQLNASIGISIYPDDGDDPDTLIARADAAMYRAKRTGRGRHVFHGEALAHAGARPPPASGGASRRPAYRQQAEAEHAQMQEVNQQLLMAALNAQGLQADAELAHRQQQGYLAVLAHELRNPLTPLRMAAELLGHIHSDGTKLPRLQAMIERQVTHMTRMVSDLLDVSRAETGKLRIERRPIELADIIEDTVGACRPAMDARRQRLDLDLPARAIEMQGDPVRIAQILGNLLDNASRYTPDAGEIALVVTATAEAIEISVSDNGIGITAEVLPHVFEPFVQDARATHFNGAGLGIGLTLVRELAEAHGGRVAVSSAGSGLGSTFVVVLPVSGDAP